VTATSLAMPGTRGRRTLAMPPGGAGIAPGAPSTLAVASGAPGPGYSPVQTFRMSRTGFAVPPSATVTGVELRTGSVAGRQRSVVDATPANGAAISPIHESLKVKRPYSSADVRLSRSFESRISTRAIGSAVPSGVTTVPV